MTVRQRSAEHLGELQDSGSAPTCPLCDDGAVQVDVQLPLCARRRRVRTEVTLEMSHREVGQVVRTLVRVTQVCGEQGVETDPCQMHATAGQGVHRVLGAVHALGRTRVGQPRGQRGLVLGSERGEVEPDHVGGIGGGSQLPGVARPGRRRPHDVQSEHLAGVFREPVRQCPGRRGGHRHLELTTGRLLLRHHRQQPFAQDPELQGIEYPVHGLPVPGLGRETVHVDRELQVVGRLVQLAVQPDLVDVLPQTLPCLPSDLTCRRQDPVQVPVHADPLRGGLRPHAGNSREVVAGLPDERCQVRVTLRRDAVLVEHGRRGVPDQIGHALARVEHRDVLADELQRVPVAGTDEDPHPGGDRASGQGGDDVVRLEGLLLHRGDAERAEHLLDQRYLT